MAFTKISSLIKDYLWAHLQFLDWGCQVERKGSLQIFKGRWARSSRSPLHPAQVALEDNSVNSDFVTPGQGFLHALGPVEVQIHYRKHVIIIDPHVCSRFSDRLQIRHLQCSPQKGHTQCLLQLKSNKTPAQQWEKSCGKQFSSTFICASSLHHIALSCGIAGSPITFSSSPSISIHWALAFHPSSFPWAVFLWYAFNIYPSSPQEMFSEWAGSDYMTLRSLLAPTSS